MGKARLWSLRMWWWLQRRELVTGVVDWLVDWLNETEASDVEADHK